MSENKDGDYCSVCGGIPPEKITTKKIVIDGKEIGIERLDWILDEVAKLFLKDDARIAEELLMRVKVYNYVPMKKTEDYAAALLGEYRRRSAGR
ncbi:MAG: NAC family transcription factor [Methanomicrobiaceae archaeon]|nr:NAC family transcription factor [Methanomicrobiaceae archaeon]MDD5418547.1 NAC family transcription factor [Methanomicrobiaceae archaeon]